MNKQEFLDALKKALSGLPHEEVKKSVDFYSEMIDDAVENGETEFAVTERIGSVKEIADKIINDTSTSKSETNVKPNASSIALIIILSPIWLPLAVAAFSVIFSLLVSLWAVVISFFASSAIFASCGAALMLSAPFIIISASFADGLLQFGAGLVCAGIAVFVFYLSVLLAKLMVRLTLFTARVIKNIFTRKGGKENEAA